jgi:hypothetical protein
VIYAAKQPLSNEGNLAFIPKPFITKALLNAMLRQAVKPLTFLQFIPEELLTLRFVKSILLKIPQSIDSFLRNIKLYPSQKVILQKISII